MFNVCYHCGQYRADKTISPDGKYAICPECGHRHRFHRLPLLLVSGASGTGKSTVCQHLTGRLEPVVVLDSDILWRPEFDRPETHYRDYMELWLRLCKNIGQSGRPVALFGAGLGYPDNLEPCIERRYFSALHYLALTCDDAVLADRLHARPAWRTSAQTDFIQEHLRYNAWFKRNAAAHNPPITLLDTTERSIEATAAQVSEWMLERSTLASRDATGTLL